MLLQGGAGSAASASSSAAAAAATLDKKWSHLAPAVIPPFTPSQSAALAEMTARAREKYADDAALLAFLDETNAPFRYLWTHDWSVKKSMENLERTVAWRRATVHPRLHCGACAAEPRTHCFVRIGTDRWRRPIVYFCPSRCTSSETAATQQHATAEMEVAFKAPGVASNWVFILDLRGFGLFGGYSKAAAKDMIDTFTLHYPERLGAMILIDLGTMMSVFLSAIKAFMDPQTVRKLSNVASRDIAAIADALCGDDADTARWLVAAVTSDAKPGNLPPLPRTAPVPVHTLAAAGLTLDDVIKRTEAGDTFDEFKPKA